MARDGHSMAGPSEARGRRADERSILRPTKSPCPVPERGVLGCFLESAQRRPDDPFLDYLAHDADDQVHGVRFSYDEFARATHGAVELLRECGTSPGDYVVVMIRNSPETLALYLAGAATGVRIVPLDQASTMAEVEYPLRMVRPGVLLVRPELVDATTRVARELPEPPLVRAVPETAASQWATRHSPLTFDDVAPLPLDDVAVVVFTSGTTTARPKGVMLTHRNLFWGPAGFADALEVRAGDRVMVVTPLHHVNALQFGIGAALVTGASVALVERFSASHFWDAVERLRPTVLWTMGGIVAILLTLEVTSTEERARRMLRAVFAAAVGQHAAFVRERIAPLVMDCYGLSESSGGTYTSTGGSGDDSNTPSVGTPLPHLTMMVVDTHGSPLPRGEIGEIVVVHDGGNVMAGYLGEPELDAAVFRDGLLWTGDLGFVGRVDGELHFHGRKKDMIRRGGVNISAMEIENVLMGHPDVSACAVVPVPDAVLGEVVAAFVCIDPSSAAGLNADELRTYCRSVLSRHKVPQHLVVLDQLPRTTTGKILKRTLRDRFASR